MDLPSLRDEVAEAAAEQAEKAPIRMADLGQGQAQGVIYRG